MAVRIGIDVGGTFTDAVVIDDDTYELIGAIKIPTTHDAPEGVAAGIVMALEKIIKDYGLAPWDVVFIAHGTTQATNALLEGDVEKVAILGIGRGVEGYKVKLDTAIGDIELASQKYLHTKHFFISQDGQIDNLIDDAVQEMKKDSINVGVVSAAYSVDDPGDEDYVMGKLIKHDIIGTCSYEISKLYGLRIRTRTAVINASILPKMLQTATMTEESVLKAKITAPLMIMRCDGGVMSVKEIQKRPLMTLLSGPAAGVAGALMYEKISEGIFLEVGGTSTDISVIHNGQVMISYAEVGGHKTYLNSLDIRTVGIAGGSLIKMDKGKIADVGPRSAHIAGLPYISYTRPEELGELEVFPISHVRDKSAYVGLRDKSTDKKYAVTLACAANASGFVEEGDYAKGHKESADKAFEVLSAYFNMPVDKLLALINQKAVDKNKKVILKMIEDYELNSDQLSVYGGGGGAAAVVAPLAKALKMKHKIVKNAEVISPIGVALAMVRDIVERSIENPSEGDITRIRKEAESQAIKSGAKPETIEVFIEVDPRKNLVRAIATGATELKTKDLLNRKLDDQQLLDIARNFMSKSDTKTRLVAKTDEFAVFQAESKKSGILGILSSKKYPTRVLNTDGVVRLQSRDGVVINSNAAKCREDLEHYIRMLTKYTEGGEKIPQTFMMVGPRLLDFSKLLNMEQVITLQALEMAGVESEKPVIIVMTRDV